MKYHKSVFDVLTYCLVTNQKEIEKVITKFKLPSDCLPNYEDSDAYMFYDPHTRLAVVRMMHNDLPLSEMVGIIVHEATHVKQQLMERISEHNPSDEFEAYTLQEIAQNLIQDYFKKQGIKNIKK